MRGLLLGIITLGSVASGVGFTGVIAPTTDTAKTGRTTKENVQTGVFPPLVDLKVASNSTAGCGTFVDDLRTPVVSYNSGSLRDINQMFRVCVKNVGSRAVPVAFDVEAITVTELTCEPDEAAVVLTGCAVGPDNGLRLRYKIYADPGQQGLCPDVVSQDLEELFFGANPDPIATSAGLPLNTDCIYIVRILSPEDGFPDDAQTDLIEWRFRIDSV